MKIQPSFGARLLDVKVNSKGDFQSRPGSNYADLSLDTYTKEANAFRAKQGEGGSFSVIDPGAVDVTHTNPFPQIAVSGPPRDPVGPSVWEGRRMILTPADQDELVERTIEGGETYEDVLRELRARAEALELVSLKFTVSRGEGHPDELVVELQNRAELAGVSFESPPLAKASAFQ